MGLFNNIIERKIDGSSTIVNYDIILTEYARTKDLANYLHKGRNEQGLDKEAYKRSFKNEHDFHILINQERLPKGIFMGNYNIWDYSIIL